MVMAAHYLEQSAGLSTGRMPAAQEVYRLIGELEETADPGSRITLIARMGASGDPRYVTALVGCCREKSPEVRRHAIEALYRIRSGRAVEVLLERLQDKNEQPAIRTRAADTLMLIRTYSAVEGLRDRLKDLGEDRTIQKHISDAMGRARMLYG